jgi:hypothetical protein
VNFLIYLKSKPLQQHIFFRAAHSPEQGFVELCFFGWKKKFVYPKSVGVDDNFQQMFQPFFTFDFGVYKFSHVTENCGWQFPLEILVQCGEGSAPQQVQLLTAAYFAPDVGKLGWWIYLLLTENKIIYMYGTNKSIFTRNMCRGAGSSAVFAWELHSLSGTAIWEKLWLGFFLPSSASSALEMGCRWAAFTMSLLEIRFVNTWNLFLKRLVGENNLFSRKNCLYTKHKL